MSRPLRVHALIDGLIGGGAEMLLSEFASAAPSAGIELSVAALSDSAGRPAAARLAERGVEPSFVPITSIIHPRELLRVRAHLAQVRPDLLHTHLGNADLLGGVAARSLGIPAVSTIHADWWRSDARQRVRLQLMALARRFCMNRVLTVSESARRAYLAERWDRPEHVQIVHNGIAARPAPGSGARVRAELDIPADATVLTMMSTLRPEKGFDIAVEVARLLSATRPDLRLLIAGGGPYEEGVRALAAALPGHAVLAGHRDDVMEVLDAGDILFQPSRYDAFPTTLLEAMAARLPIVATAVGGIPELVSDGQTGVLVAPPPEPEKFVAVLGPLLDDPARRARLAEAARARFEAEFTAEQWAQRLRAVYDDVLSSRPAHRSILSRR